MGQVLLQLVPDPWHQSQIVRLARNKTEPRENPQNPQCTLRPKNGIAGVKASIGPRGNLEAVDHLQLCFT